MLIRVGSRGSRLALTQAELAASRVRVPGIEIALVPITTAGDRDRSKPFGQIGTRGVFVKELEEALLERRIDVAVHSAKDMTSTDPEGLSVGAYIERDDPRDALCGADSIRAGMRVGTASARRKAQLLALEPTLSIEPLRGNIDTRLRKRAERGLDAIVLAACGLDRLGLGHEIGRRFDPSGYDWVVVTSPNGAHELARRLASTPKHLAAIGSGTAEALREHGLRPDLVPRVSTQEGLLAELPDGRVLLAAAEGARRLLVQERDADFVPLYRTVELRPPPPDGDVALLASPSAARAFAATGAHVPVIVIGPQTEAEARGRGLEVVAVATSPDLDGLLDAVASL